MLHQMSHPLIYVIEISYPIVIFINFKLKLTIQYAYDAQEVCK